MSEADFLIIGSGIAGASLGAGLAAHGRVLVLEAESQPGHHATGRSAAHFIETYGPPGVRALTRASRAFFEDAPAGFDGPLASPRPVLHLAGAGREAALDTFMATPDVRPHVERIDGAAARAKVPVLRADTTAGAALESGALELDVDRIHRGYLRILRTRGGVVATDSPVRAIARRGGSWEVSAGTETLRTPVLVNAAGAWADEIARLAGVSSLCLSPKRRTAITVDVPPEHGVERWPMVLDLDEQFYFKPDAGRLLVSPADATPSDPCDAQPDELDVAIAIHRLEEATTLRVARPAARWAGLRTFAPDGEPVLGFDAQAPGFFWCAGQGGYGLQIAPALARLGASLVVGDAPSDIGVVPSRFAPARFLQEIAA